MRPEDVAIQSGSIAVIYHGNPLASDLPHETGPHLKWVLWVLTCPRKLYQLEVEQIFRERFLLLARDRSAMVRSVTDRMDEIVERLNTVEMGDETEEQLRALGYAN